MDNIVCCDELWLANEALDDDVDSGQSWSDEARERDEEELSEVIELFNEEKILERWSGDNEGLLLVFFVSSPLFGRFVWVFRVIELSKSKNKYD